ncbi:hypothetical protein MTO96_039090 [Rhipicephalus appendiculatus]
MPSMNWSQRESSVATKEHEEASSRNAATYSCMDSPGCWVRRRKRWRSTTTLLAEAKCCVNAAAAWSYDDGAAANFLPSSVSVAIGNADQTPVYFDMASNTTVSVKGERDVNLLTTGNEKLRFTVMLSCLADGTKLRPYIVFKRKTMPKEVLLKGVVVRANAKGFMTDDMVVECSYDGSSTSEDDSSDDE